MPIVALIALTVVSAIGVGTWEVVRERPPIALQPASKAEVPAHPFGYVDAPSSSTIVGPRVRLAGWALGAQGIDRVEVRLDGVPHAARYGLPRTDVGAIHHSLPGADHGGFAFEADLSGRLDSRHELRIVAIDRRGIEHQIGRKFVVAPEALSRWKPLLEARPGLANDRFHLLPATSGVKLHGADEIADTYAPYESTTQRAGVRVPILYLRTTHGRAQDWTFDPDWDIERRCGERRIADDSLNSVIAYAIRHRLPVMFTLNGGVWGDATCDVPDWDVNDELERDVMNCQWTARGTVPPDDALRGLAGSLSSPEIARALTLNVYAKQPRAYKRRNLQEAARVVAQFASHHPELFVGVSLDPDVYVLPWFQGREWFDYNPGTIRQFRHWLQGSGPYRGEGGNGVPDLSAYRRSRTFTLDEVRAMARQPFASWDAVDPPRVFPLQGGPGHQDEWRDPWLLVWDQFRRHLVHVHYDELAAWTVAAGIDAGKVFTAQAYTAADAGYLPKASRVEGGATDYDSGGVSVEGAIPKQGRLGVILYGESTSNTARTDTGEPPFRIFQRMADRFGVVELSLASLKDFAYRPGYADGYRAFREITNAGALLVSPMAWNGWNGLFADQPGYQAYTSWRNTPAEDAMLDRMVERANLPASAKLWTFGSPRHRDADGWTVDAPASIVENTGTIDVAGGSRIRLLSPAGLWIRADRFDTLVARLPDAPPSTRIVVRGRVDGTGRWITLASSIALRTLPATAAGHAVPLSWPEGRMVVDQLAIEFERDDQTTPLRIDHVALYPREPAR